jgi:serine/threonine protein kinase
VISYSATRRAPTPGRPPAAGVDSDRYEVEGEIARGGHAVVLRAIDRRLRRPVAIKQLRKRTVSESRFLGEALITARLRHPSIVPIYDVGCWSDGTPYFAMELVEGVTLRDRIVAARSRRERLGLLSSVIAVTDAVAYAHANRIIHRDLKPSNVLVSDFGQTIVIDWGIAKLVDEPPELDPSVAAVVGTPYYMSPEQAAGDDVDARTDIYALGAIVYHLIAGRAPYAEHTGDEVITRVRRGPPPPLTERFPGVSRALVAVVERAMARDRSDRYRSAAELRDDLADFRRESDRVG